MCDEILDDFAGLSITVSEHGRIVANCRDMCPTSEMVFRERNGLLHRLELINPDDWDQYRAVSRHKGGGNRRGNVRNDHHHQPNINKQFTNKWKVVKQFKRSSAGQNLLHADDIRPSEVLRRTVDYLLTDLLGSLSRAERPLLQFGYYYDFTFDRLRSVRQDMVVQRISDENCFYILERCIDFYVHSHYLFQFYQSTKSKTELTQLCSHFDAHLNQVHLSECLTLLLRYYDHFEDSVWSIRRPLYEAMFFIYNLESNKSALKRYELLHRSVWSKDLFTSRIVQISGRVIFAHLLGNPIKCLRLVAAQLATNPLFSLTFFISNLSYIHLRLLRQICIAFRSPNTVIPLSTLSTWFCPSQHDQIKCANYLEHVCTHFQIPLVESCRPKKTPSYDYFSFNDSEEDDEDDNKDNKVEQKQMLITKKFANIDQWKWPAELHPIGWFARLDNLYKIFQN